MGSCQLQQVMVWCIVVLGPAGTWSNCLCLLIWSTTIYIVGASEYTVKWLVH